VITVKNGAFRHSIDRSSLYCRDTGRRNVQPKEPITEADLGESLEKTPLTCAYFEHGVALQVATQRNDIVRLADCAQAPPFGVCIRVVIVVVRLYVVGKLDLIHLQLLLPIRMR
jgi:hypothetical protein